jgi:diguanylate cyclase (GGDEF)-like protein
VADDLLRRVARALTTHMRRTDTVCRFAGDRFALVLPETDRERMDAVLAKIRASLGEIQYQAEGHPRRLAAAYVTAHYPEDGSTEMELVHSLLARARAAKQQSATAGGA